MIAMDAACPRHAVKTTSPDTSNSLERWAKIERFKCFLLSVWFLVLGVGKLQRLRNHLLQSLVENLGLLPGGPLAGLSRIQASPIENSRFHRIFAANACAQNRG